MIAVLGCGLFGAAAARHLAKSGHEVTLIGPSEPDDKRSHRGVFGSHYDEGRITRKNALDPFWVGVSKAAISRYGEIEAESGISFYTAAGAMMAGRSDYIKRVDAATDVHGVGCEKLDASHLAERFSYLSFPSDFVARYEADEAGYVSARNLVAAQTEAARRHGAVIVNDTVTGFKERPDHVQIVTQTQTYCADQVLVAAGAMSDLLLGRAPELDVYQRTVALFELDETEVGRLAGMPSLVFESAESCYVLPPIRYPDGKFYLKIGGDPEDIPLRGEAEIGNWFRAGGSAQVRDKLEEIIRALIPGLAVRAVSMDACVTTWTKTRLPEISALSKRVALCGGGNGAGAKCSDELGRLGAVKVMELAGETV